MKLIRFLDPSGAPRYGSLAQDRLAFPLVGEPFGVHSFEPRPIAVGRLLPPVLPPNVVAIGRNYADHAREMNGQAPAEPLVFLKATTSVIGPQDDIVLPAPAPDEVDFEAELAVVIGRTAKNVSAADAPRFILGYTCANDVSARDCQQRRDKQWARAKSFDTFCPLGPEIVTGDALSPDALRVRSILNGKVMQDGNTRDMIFPVARLVAYLSRQFTLLAGTVILTGTPAGVGAARTPPVYLRPGDTVCVEIEGIGTLASRVVSESSGCRAACPSGKAALSESPDPG